MCDRRRNVITITATGRERLRQVDVRLARAQDDLLGPLSDTDRDHLVELLQRVLDITGGPADY